MSEETTGGKGKNPLGWFKFYGDDFFGDDKVQQMGWAIKGQYLFLLWHQFRYGGIPKDWKTVWNMLGNPYGSMARWTAQPGCIAMQHCFPVSDKHDIRINPRMARVRGDAFRKSATKRANRRATAVKRKPGADGRKADDCPFKEADSLKDARVGAREKSCPSARFSIDSEIKKLYDEYTGKGLISKSEADRLRFFGKAFCLKRRRNVQNWQGCLRSVIEDPKKKEWSRRILPADEDAGHEAIKRLQKKGLL